MWGGHLIRRGWRATIFLALLAGLAGGLAMAAWAAGRRTATSFDRFVAWADPPDLLVTFCPPGFEPGDHESLLECFTYEATREIATLNKLPEVELTARAAFVGTSVRRAVAPSQRYLAGSGFVLDEGLAGFDGRQILVEGRQVAPGADDEVVVNEAFAEQSGVTVGEELMLAFWARGEFGSIPPPGEDYSGASAHARVVGIVRGILGLDVVSTDVSRIIEQAEVLGGPAFAGTTSGEGFGGVLIRATDPFPAGPNGQVECGGGRVR